MPQADASVSPVAFSLGEVLIDFVALEGLTLAQAPTFQRAAGGAPANVDLCLLSALRRAAES